MLLRGVCLFLQYLKILFETLFPNAELNLLSQGSGCPLQAGTGHGLPGRALG